MQTRDGYLFLTNINHTPIQSDLSTFLSAQMMAPEIIIENPQSVHCLTFTITQSQFKSLMDYFYQHQNIKIKIIFYKFKKL